jgi:hypothetical protein
LGIAGRVLDRCCRLLEMFDKFPRLGRPWVNCDIFCIAMVTFGSNYKRKCFIY